MNTEDVLDTLSDKKVGIFSTLDLRSGHWQVRSDPETSHKTAFITHEGFCKFNRLAFGLRNSSFVFTQLMHVVLRKLIFKSCLVYIDDILCFSADINKHMEHLSEIFHRFRKANLKFYPG